MREVEVRKKILDFVLEEYKKEKKVPSVRKIKEFAGINTNKFYKIFPGGIKDVCEATNLPFPEKRVLAARLASQKRKRRKEEEKLKIELTDSQQMKLFRIAYLENKDVSLVMDDLIQLHHHLYENKIELRVIEEYLRLLKAAKENGWKEEDVIKFLEWWRKFKSIILQNPNVFKTIFNFFSEAEKKGEKTEDIIKTIETISKIEAQGIDIESLNLEYLQNTLKEAKKRKWNPASFCDFVAKSENIITELKNRVSALRREIKKIEEKKKAKEEEIKRLEKEYEEKKREKEQEFQSLIENLNKVVEKKGETIQKLQKEIKNLEEAENQKLQEYQKIENEVERFKKNSEDLKNRLSLEIQQKLEEENEIKNEVERIKKKETILFAANTLFKFLREEPLSKFEIEALIDTLEKIKKEDVNISVKSEDYQKIRQRIERFFAGILDKEFNYKKQIEELNQAQSLINFENFNLRVENEKLRRESEELKKKVEEIEKIEDAIRDLLEGKQLTEEQKKILQPYLEKIALDERIGAILGEVIKGVVGKHEKKE
jgi:DNA repair exonuclease SbcCD ATPase subunit